MLTRVWSLVLIVGVGLGLLFWAQRCAQRSGDAPKLSPQTQHDLDSLTITRPTHDARQDTLLQMASRDSARAVQAERRARHDSVTAVAAQQRADSLAAVAQTAEQWKAAHDERALEAVQWQRAANENAGALQLERDAHSRTRIALAEEKARRIHLETVTVPDLRRDFESLQRPCRLGFVPCPSRTVVGLLSALAGVGAGYALPHP